MPGRVHVTISPSRWPGSPKEELLNLRKESVAFWEICRDERWQTMELTLTAYSVGNTSNSWRGQADGRAGQRVAEGAYVSTMLIGHRRWPRGASIIGPDGEKGLISSEISGHVSHLPVKTKMNFTDTNVIRQQCQRQNL